MCKGYREESLKSRKLSCINILWMGQKVTHAFYASPLVNNLIEKCFTLIHIGLYPLFYQCLQLPTLISLHRLM